MDYRAHLVKQLGFLWRSCAAYDQGCIDEAIRIATVIRVLLHDTRNSTSLLKHLDALQIGLSSTVSSMDRSRTVFWFGMGQGTFTANGGTWRANTDATAIDRQLPVSDWLNQVVFISGSVQATRKNLILTAADNGFVYVFGNRGLSAYKVGMTTRALRLRASELQREYGTVYPFEIASRHAVDDPAAVEALAHRILARYRVPRSELFSCDLDTCRRAVASAALLVLDRPWWLRVWHWLTLPRPAPLRRPYARRRYRRDDPASFVVLLVVVGLVLGLAVLKPDLPPWVPSSMLRAVAILQRLH